MLSKIGRVAFEHSNLGECGLEGIVVRQGSLTMMSDDSICQAPDGRERVISRLKTVLQVVGDVPKTEADEGLWEVCLGGGKLYCNRWFFKKIDAGS